MYTKMFLSFFAISCLVFEINASYGILHNTGIGPINQPCQSGNINCIAAANMRAVIPYLGDGIPELGIRGLEPMILHNITMDQGFFKLVFPTMKLFGSRQCKVAALHTDVLQKTTTVSLDCPVEAIGKYILTAKSYIFDISNEGNYVLQSDSIRTTITSKYETIYGNDGKQYWNLVDYAYFYEPLEKLHVELGNLFSGDIEKGQFFLNFMPNGWAVSIAKIAEPVVNSAVSHFFEVFKVALRRLAIN